MGSSNASTSQLVQAMAGFDGGSDAVGSFDAAAFGPDTTPQPLLTTSQHA